MPFSTVCRKIEKQIKCVQFRSDVRDILCGVSVVENLACIFMRYYWICECSKTI